MIKSIPEEESENFQPAWIITKEQAKEYQIKALRYQKYVEYKNSEEFRNLQKQEKFWSFRKTLVFYKYFRVKYDQQSITELVADIEHWDIIENRVINYSKKF